MPQMQDEAGNIWEVDAQGNAVALVRAAGAQASNVVAPSPARLAQRDAEEARKAADDARAAEKQRQDAIKFAAEYNPDGTKKAQAPALTAKERADAIAAFTTANQMDKLIADMEAKFNDGPGATKGLMGAADFLPTQANDQFDKAAQAVRGQVGTLLGFTGGQLNSVAEAQMAVGPYLPSSSNYDATALDKFARLKELSDLARTRSIAILGGVPDANGQITPVNPQATQATAPQGQQDAPPLVPPPFAGGAGGTNGGPPASPLTNMGDPYATRIASGPTRNVPASRIEKQIDAMMNAGASKAMIDTVLKQQGIPPISPEQYNAAKTWMKQNPGKAYYGADSGQVEDMSLLQRAAGSEAGSLVANMADGFTAGTSTALAGDTGKAALDAMKAQNPNASIAGSLIGGVTGAGMAEAALLARAPAALAKYAPRIADAAYGGLTGFNAAEEGQGGTGALTGAAAGLVGGLVGEGAMRGAGAVARGVTNPAAQYLRELGVPLTVGQAMGGGFKKVEDALTSIPFVGNMIDRRRGEGLDAFNKAAFDIGAETTGGQVQDIGSDGIQQLAGLRSQAYDNALGPVRIDASDPQFGQDVAAAYGSAQRIPNVNSAQDAAIAGLQSRIDGAINPMTDQMTGRGFQEAYRGLARTGRERANSDYGAEVGQVMREGQDALAGALERQNPGAYQGFVDANTANRRLMVLADAVDKAKNQDGRFMPSQLNMADAGSANRLTGKVASAGGERPFAELANAGQEVLPSKMGDSGTFTRALVGLGATGGLGGAGYAAGDGSGAATGTGMGLGATLALALGGTKGAQSLAVRGLMDRPDFAVAIGEQLKRNARIGSAGGAGLGAYLNSMLSE